MADLPRYLSIGEIDQIVARALEEDIGLGDATTAATVAENARGRASFRAKQEGVVAGLTVANRVFTNLDASAEVQWSVADGDAVRAGDELGVVRGRARALLTGERTALNLLQRMSGIATYTVAMVEAVEPHGATILDTRKTAPGLRLLDKWAVRIGGGQNHRIGLFDMILIKENHIAAAGGISSALAAARRWMEENGRLPIEVEVRSLEELDEVIGAGDVDMVLLDNMARQDTNELDVELLRKAVERVGGRIRTEASGNVTLETVERIAATGVDYISSGALTHSVHAVDISMTVAL